MMSIILIFSRFFNVNVIIECLISVLVFLIVSPPRPLWAVVSGVVAFLALGAHVFIVHIICLFLGCDVLPMMKTELLHAY